MLDRQLERIEYFLSKERGSPSIFDLGMWIEYWQDRILYGLRCWSSDFYRSWLRPFLCLFIGYLAINAVPFFLIESFSISHWKDLTLRPITELATYEASLKQILGMVEYETLSDADKRNLKLAGWAQTVWIAMWSFPFAKESGGNSTIWLPGYRPTAEGRDWGLLPAVGILYFLIFPNGGGTLLFERNNLYHYLTHAQTGSTWWSMIQGTKGKLARNAVRGLYGKGFPSELVRRTRTMLLALDAADSLEDLRFPPGNHLELLGGDRKGYHSLRINSQWRICFLWTERGPADVEIVDYH